MIFVAPWLGQHLSWALFVISLLLIVATIAMLLATAFVNPGFLPRDLQSSEDDIEWGCATLGFRPVAFAARLRSNEGMTLLERIRDTCTRRLTLPCCRQAAEPDEGADGERIRADHEVVHHVQPLPAATVQPLRGVRQLRRQVRPPLPVGRHLHRTGALWENMIARGTAQCPSTPATKAVCSSHSWQTALSASVRQLSVGGTRNNNACMVCPRLLVCPAFDRAASSLHAALTGCEAQRRQPRRSGSQRLPVDGNSCSVRSETTASSCRSCSWPQHCAAGCSRCRWCSC